jgi:hypothetical protein
MLALAVSGRFETDDAVEAGFAVAREACHPALTRATGCACWVAGALAGIGGIRTKD